MKGETGDSLEDLNFMKHFKNTYQDFPTVPIWMITEVMSFGTLSMAYHGLINNSRAGVEDKKIIADHFGLHYRKLGDWLHILTVIRNIYAHHGRLWNRQLSIRTSRAREPNWLPPITPRDDRLFYVLLMLRHLLRASGNGDGWDAAGDG